MSAMLCSLHKADNETCTYTGSSTVMQVDAGTWTKLDDFQKLVSL